MTDATSPESKPPEQPSVSAPSLRARLAEFQAALASHGAYVDPSPLPDYALAPKLAAERQRLRAIERP